MKRLMWIMLIATTILVAGCTDKTTPIDVPVIETSDGETGTLSTFNTGTTAPIDTGNIETNIATDEKDDTISSETTKMDPPETREVLGLGKIKCGFQSDKKLTPRRGYIATTCQWIDRRGNNIIIISYRPPYNWKEENPSMAKFAPDDDYSTEITELFAYHYVYNNDLQKWKTYWTLHDFEFGSSGVGMDYQPKSLDISDRDNDGNAESSFFYTIRGGTSRNDCYYSAKLIFHPDVTKYKVEGTTGLGKEWLEDGEYTEKIIEKYDKNLSKENLDYLKIKWAKYHKEQLRLDAIRSQGHC